MPNYDKSIAISHEEEGSYHRREVRPCSPVNNTTTTTTTSYPVTTRYIERYTPEKTRSVRPATSGKLASSDDEDNYQEWTTSKRKVNHKTRQVETRVSRQLLVRGGEVIADSGPQVTTRIKEDNKVEESEKEKTPKNKEAFEALDGAPRSSGETSGLVLGKKKEILRKSREVREENMQYHDERFKELTGKDVHRRAIQAPHELITINDKTNASSKPRGKMIHYSNKGKKYQDTDEIEEVAKLAIDGSVTKEVKHTKHHEEFSEDELPDEKGEAEQLKRKPVVERTTRRHADTVNDFDQIDAAPGQYSAVEHFSGSEPGSPEQRRRHNSQQQRSRRPISREEEEAFPRYEIDPLLNSLRDEDFKPRDSNTGRRHQVEKEEMARFSRRRHQSASSASDSESERPARRRGSPSPGADNRVEVPEEIRMNKQRLLASKSGGPGSSLSHKSNRSALTSGRRREDAGTQARLTDEEVERRSMRSSSPSLHSHAKATRYLERQATPNASRHYYYGDKQQHQATGKKRQQKQQARRLSVSSSASSLSSVEVKRTQSRDSGFKSPHSQRTSGSPTVDQEKAQLYSVSSKQAKNARHGAVSPSDSLGQRSVKTTTTTLSAGLADRPLSPDGQENRRSRNKSARAASDKLRQEQRIKRRQRPATSDEDDGHSVITITNEQQRSRPLDAYDTVSLASLQSPSATKIKVPYQRVIEIERERGNINKRQVLASNKSDQLAAQSASGIAQAKSGSQSSEMSFQEDIENLSKRLASISQSNENQQHFDYKTVVANVHAVPAKQQVVGSYNVSIQQQNSPFQQTKESTVVPIMPSSSNSNNNNEANFSLDDYVKYRATPALVDRSLQSSNGQMDEEDDERMSQNSSCSLQSARTYNIRKLGDIATTTSTERASGQSQEVKSQDQEQENTAPSIAFDENGNGKSAAWIFDPRDNSSTAIVPPARPRRPATPPISSKTEELSQSRGGRSYYLELVEPGGGAKRPRPSSIDSLYSRWNSQGALNSQQGTYRPLASSARQNLPSGRTINNSASQNRLATQMNQQSRPPFRRQLPFSGPPSSLGDRSKSSSCLLSVTRPSKYSIYGGFRKPGESNKPVPRLSYSRAIGPRSSRVDTTPSAPSRYLKMR